MKPLTDNIGSQACHTQTGITSSTTNTSFTPSLSSASSSSVSNHSHPQQQPPDLIAMATSLASAQTNSEKYENNIKPLNGSKNSSSNNNGCCNIISNDISGNSKTNNKTINNNNKNSNISTKLPPSSESIKTATCLRHVNESSPTTPNHSCCESTTELSNFNTSKMPSTVETNKVVVNGEANVIAASATSITQNNNNNNSGISNGNHSSAFSKSFAEAAKSSEKTPSKLNNSSSNGDSSGSTTNGSYDYHHSNHHHHHQNNSSSTTPQLHHKNYHFPQHSPNNAMDYNACAAAAAAVAVLDTPETEDSKPVFLEYSSTGSNIYPNNNQLNQNGSYQTQEEAQNNNNNITSTPTTSNPPKASPPYPNNSNASSTDHRNDLLTSINALRKQGQFCDIKLLVEDHEIPAHRAVLATSSPYLFDFLSCLEESECLQPCYRIKDVPYVGFQHLLDYMYTGKLEVPLSQVPVVYGTALALRMETPARVCADFLSSHLTDANCLVIRRFSRDNDFRAAVDEYIKGNMEGILGCKSFFGLRNLQVEVVGLDESIDDETMERRLFSLVLDWAKTNLNDLKPKMDRLTEQVNVLYLNPDNTLMDCADMEDSVLSSDDDVVLDYKKMARRRSKTKPSNTHSMGSSSGNGISGGQPFHKFSLNPEEAVSVAEREWSIIATRKTTDNSYLSIAVLDGQLMAVSIHVRPPAPASTDGNNSIRDPDSPTSTGVQNGVRGPSPTLRKTSIAPLESMSTARCAMGAVALDGQIVVFGGYDRGECLQSVEAFSLLDNQWSTLPPMKAARGRFSAAALDGYVYTCGGSDGWKELSCVERFEPGTGEWKFMANMIKERSSHGVVTLNGKLYCIGGSDGQRSIADCEVYDPESNKWSRMAPLNMARSQTCVCEFQGQLYAIGGTDSWNTLNTVEVYDPHVGEWVVHSTLNIARRGSGVDIVDGTMVVVGGSDGVQSLTSVEFYNQETSQWSMGPPMITPRANLSAVTVGSRLFAIGGFSGKKFLSSVEWLEMEDKEWLGHAPKMVDLNASIASGSVSGGES